MEESIDMMYLSQVTKLIVLILNLIEFQGKKHIFGLEFKNNNIILELQYCVLSTYGTFY